MPNSRPFGAPFIYHNLGTPYFRLQSKIQKSSSRLWLGLLKGFQNGMSQPHCKNTHRRQDPWKRTFARPKTWWWAPWGRVTNPTIQLGNLYLLTSIHSFVHSFTPCVKDNILVPQTAWFIENQTHSTVETSSGHFPLRSFLQNGRNHFIRF